MERCPNCGAPARPGAKFCTTCGFRFPGDQSRVETVGQDRDSARPSEDAPTLFMGEPSGEWPAPPSTGEPMADGWAQPAPAAISDPATPTDIQVDSEVASGSWPNETMDPWPAPPPSISTAPVVTESATNFVEGEQAVDDNALPADDVENTVPSTRALRLIDELRDIISTTGLNSTSDLSGIIAELEVAVTPPGAMAPGDVAELREALLVARERPRDVDTIIDLTKRVDAMLTLVIAYDRTIAAIERSLEALRASQASSDQ